MDAPVPRLYEAVLKHHLARERQMAFVTGPRQVGKTTTCRGLATHYLNWDNSDDRRSVFAGPAALARHLDLDRLRAGRPVAVLDEFHKHRRWKGFLKGFFDTYEARLGILVTGSSRMDVFRRGGDSLAGRYFLYRMHPLSVAELARPIPPHAAPAPPAPLQEEAFATLWTHGGFPEPFVKRSPEFTRRWRRLRREQIVREEVRDTFPIQDLGALEHLETLLETRSGGQLVLSDLAREVGVSVVTARRWVEVFCLLHHGFLVRPWHRNVARALRKAPKWYLRDWSGIEDPGARAETFVACHLLKAVEGWTDLGLGEFELRYLRDKEKRETDFLVLRDRRPWCLVEVKASDTRLSPALAYFQKRTGADHAFQAVVELAYEPADPFRHRTPLIVPARTLLSQLL